MPTFQKFDAFAAAPYNGVHNLSTASLKVALTDTAPTSSDDFLADITEISYTNISTRTLSGVTSTQSGGVYRLKADDLVLTASGSVGPFRYIVIYNDTAASDPLICWADRGSSLTMGNGDTETLDFNGTEGLIKNS